MNDVILAEILQANYKIGNKKFGLKFSKSSSTANMISQVSTIHIIHDQVQMLSVLEGIVHINEEGMLNFG
jgi:hypothetical protein